MLGICQTGPTPTRRPSALAIELMGFRTVWELRTVLEFFRVYLDPKESTFLGFLIIISLYKSLKGRFLRVQVGFRSLWLGVSVFGVGG